MNKEITETEKSLYNRNDPYLKFLSIHFKASDYDDYIIFFLTLIVLILFTCLKFTCIVFGARILGGILKANIPTVFVQ